MRLWTGLELRRQVQIREERCREYALRREMLNVPVYRVPNGESQRFDRRQLIPWRSKKLCDSYSTTPLSWLPASGVHTAGNAYRLLTCLEAICKISLPTNPIPTFQLAGVSPIHSAQAPACLPSHPIHAPHSTAWAHYYHPLDTWVRKLESS